MMNKTFWYDDNSGTLTKYINGQGIDNKLRVQTGSDVQYFLGDHLGSTNGLADSSGNLTATTNYDAFGNASNSNFPTRYQFTGREHDSFTGLQYSRARFYDANLGRFISEDPIGFAGGDINLYGYVQNNPAMMRDPSGKFIVPLIIGGVVLGGLILASPSPVNAPAPGDPVYFPDNPLILNAAGGAACSYLFGRFASPLISKFLSGTGDDIIELGISGGPTPKLSNLPNKGLATNPFKGKTPQEIDEMLTDKGFQPSGPDPVNGYGGYVNPRSGRSYHIDPKGYGKYREPNHVDVNRLRGYKGPLKKRKYDY